MKPFCYYEHMLKAARCVYLARAAPSMSTCTCVLLKKVTIFSLLLTSKVLSLSMHLSPFPCKQLVIVPCAWFVASILLFSVVPTLNEAHQHCAGQRVSLKLNIENRYRLVNALTMVSLQILWLQEVDWLMISSGHQKA